MADENETAEQFAFTVRMALESDEWGQAELERAITARDATLIARVGELRKRVTSLIVPNDAIPDVFDHGKNYALGQVLSWLSELFPEVKGPTT